MDVRALFLSQTFALIAIAAMLWVARNEETERRNGLRTWMLAVMAQALGNRSCTPAARQGRSSLLPGQAACQNASTLADWGDDDGHVRD
jgi:hypothetical protein